MKKLVLLIMALVMMTLVLVGCGNNEEVATEDARGPVVNGQYPQDYNSHSAMNSLDYFGMYVPEDTQASPIASITIADDYTYSMVLSNGEVKKGSFGWDETGSVIHLMGADEDKTIFFVGENFIKNTTTGLRYKQQTK